MKAVHAGSIRSALKVASSTALAADALRKTAAATVYRASKNIVSSLTHTRASMTAVNVSITRIPPSPPAEKATTGQVATIWFIIAKVTHIQGPYVSNPNRV
jgi:hypothetical protein